MRKEKKIDGSGRKRPLLDIPLKYIELDPLNPRLGEENKGASHPELLSVLYEQFDLQEVAFSMSENGYFDEEPIVVVPKDVPKGFNFKDYTGKPDALQEALEKLIQEGKMTFIAVEGNRRLSTAIIMTDEKVRKSLEVDESFPLPKDSKTADDLKILPAIFYKSRDEVSPYLGVRHISGILRWEAFAKAAYIARRIEEEAKKIKDVNKSIQVARKKLGDKSDSIIKKHYMAYRIYMQAEEELGYNVRVIKDRFSLITEITGSPDIREYLGIELYKNIDFSKPIVSKKKLKELENVLTWVFGNGKDKPSIVTDSRKISSRLAPILADKDATKYLLDYGNLEEAYEQSGGEEKYLINKINSARRNIENALKVAYKYKNQDVKDAVNECQKAVGELAKMIS